MIIAELSANHGQQIDTARQLIEAAHRAGADAVKVQTYTPDTLTFRSDADCFKISGPSLWEGKTLWELYQQAYTPWEWQPELKLQAEALGMEFIASVFDASSVAFWEEHGLGTYKIASAELVDIPLLEAVAATRKKVILSTGMGSIEEIYEAVRTIEKLHPEVDLTLLKCSSAYPAPAESMHLLGIQTLAEAFGYPVGLSDHTTTDESALVAVGLGASVFEKHLKLEGDNQSPDSAFSLTPDQFATWAGKIRLAGATLGQAELGPTEAERSTLPFRKSLFVVADMAAGDIFSEKNLRSIRPAAGLPPKYYTAVLGKPSKAPIAAGTPLQWDHVAQ
jgi:pseudaminic acid synthase